jgi:hypothetical protein
MGGHSARFWGGMMLAGKIWAGFFPFIAQNDAGGQNYRHIRY